jgi:hypothetical protein
VDSEVVLVTSVGSSESAPRSAGRLRKVAGLMLLSVGLVAAAAISPEARAGQRSLEKWSSVGTIPSALTTGTPALAAFNGDLYAAWSGKGGPPTKVWYSAFNGTTWTPQSTVPAALTEPDSGGNDAGPALGVYGTDLYVAWVGKTSPYSIWYSAYDGSTWSAQAKVPSSLTDGFSSPALAEYGGDLYLAWPSQASDAIMYSAFNGTSWTAPVTIAPTSATPNPFGIGGPGLALYNGKLYVTWRTQAAAQVAYSSFNGTKWSKAHKLTSFVVFGPSALSALGSNLYVAWGTSTTTGNPAEYSIYNGSTWTTEARVSKATIIFGVGLAAYGTSMYAAWSVNNSDVIDYSATH